MVRPRALPDDIAAGGAQPSDGWVDPRANDRRPLQPLSPGADLARSGLVGLVRGAGRPAGRRPDPGRARRVLAPRTDRRSLPLYLGASGSAALSALGRGLGYAF